MSRAAVLTAPLLTLALVYCGGDSEGGTSAPSPSVTVIDIRGKITEVATPVSDVSPGGMAVEAEAEADVRYSSAWVRIDQSTTIRWSTPEDAATATIADLEPGMRVEVRFSGAVALSDPVQATAAEITIID